MQRLHIWTILTILLGTGCATSLLRATPKTDQGLYEQAMDDMDSGLYPEALDGFAQVKNKYPYSKYAPLADLRIGDTHFERGNFNEAVDAYRQFLRLHPSHAEAPYAMFQIGEAYHEQIPEDWFFMPPSAEKDQANTRLTIAAFRDMLARFPEHELSEKARERVQEGRRKLADHELYVARFYFKRDKYRAAAYRAEGLLANYAGLGLDPEALWIAARARKAMGDVKEAKIHAEKLQSEFPKSSEASKAKKLLSSLQVGTPAEEGPEEG